MVVRQVADRQRVRQFDGKRGERVGEDLIDEIVGYRDLAQPGLDSQLPWWAMKPQIAALASLWGIEPVPTVGVS